METNNEETFRAEYYAAQLAMRALDEQIFRLQQERHRYASQCHSIISQAINQGINL